MSTVFYRWGAGKDESRVTFDGTHISVFDLKREIILNNRMGNGKDFDLGVFDNVTGEGMSSSPSGGLGCSVRYAHHVVDPLVCERSGPISIHLVQSLPIMKKAFWRTHELQMSR
jgi:protein MPE1